MDKAGIELRAEVTKLIQDLKKANESFKDFEQKAVKAASGVREVEQASDNAQKKLSGFSKIVNDFKTHLGGLTGKFALGTLAANALSTAFFKVQSVIRNLISGSIDASSALTELKNKAEVVFGDTFGIVEKQVAAIAQEVQRAHSSILGFAADIGAIFDASGIGGRALADMSTQVAKLAVDLASFFNTADEEAFQALQSGLVGMVQPLRRFGIVLTQANLEQFAMEKGIKQNISTMNQAQLIALRYAYIMERTSTAQGDAARTAESFANRSRGLGDEWKTLNEELGKGITPALAEGLGVLTGVIKNTRMFVRALTDDLKTLLGVLGGGKSVGGILKGSLQKTPIIGQVMSLQEMSKKVFGLASGRINSMKAVEEAPGIETDPLDLVRQLAGGSGGSGGSGGDKDDIDKQMNKIVSLMEKLNQKNQEWLKQERERLKLKEEMGILTNEERRQLERINNLTEFQDDKVRDATQAWKDQVKALEEVEDKIKDINEKIAEEQQKLADAISDIEEDANKSKVDAAADLIREMHELEKKDDKTVEDYNRIREIDQTIDPLRQTEEGRNILKAADEDVALTDPFARIDKEKETAIEEARQESDARIAGLKEELAEAERNKTKIVQLEQEKRDAVITALNDRNTKTFAAYTALEEQTKRHVDAQLTEFNRLRTLLQDIANVELDAGNSMVPGYASGGLVRGKKGVDKIHAMLTDGEFVVNPIATQRNMSDLIRMNRETPRFANGGLVNNNQRTANITVNNHGRAAEMYSDPTLQRWRARAMLG